MTVANIGPAERRKRRAFGFIGLAFGVAVGAALIWGHVAPAWRLWLFVPLFAAAVGFFQDLRHT